MADLFCIGRAAINPALEGFSQNRVEWLLHAKVKYRVSDAEDNCFDQLVDRRFLLQFLKDQWSIGHAIYESLEVALSAEYIDWQTNAED